MPERQAGSDDDEGDRPEDVTEPADQPEDEAEEAGAPMWLFEILLGLSGGPIGTSTFPDEELDDEADDAST